MLTYGFYNSNNGDRVYDAAQVSNLLKGVITDGVFQSIGDMFNITASSGMDILIGSGRAWFNNTWTDNDGPIQLSVPLSDMLHPRIDAVVLEVDTSVGVRANTFKIVTGIPSSLPVPPTLIKNGTVNQYARVYIYVDAGSIAIDSTNITDLSGTNEFPYITGILLDETVSTSDRPAPKAHVRLSVNPNDPNPESAPGSPTADVFYAMPYEGNTYPQWNGARFVAKEFALQDITMLNDNISALYDVYMSQYENQTVVGLGRRWATPQFTSRGTGANSAEIKTVDGIDVNAFDMPLTNGSNTYNITAGYATLIGTVRLNGTGGTLKNVSWNKFTRSLANRYNVLPTYVKTTSPTLDLAHTYATATWRALPEDSSAYPYLRYVACAKCNALIDLYILGKCKSSAATVYGSLQIVETTGGARETKVFTKQASLVLLHVNDYNTDIVNLGDHLFTVEEYASAATVTFSDISAIIRMNL